MGGHVVKTGCSPYLIDLMKRGLLNGLAMNGSGAIHDLELAIIGQTSEDVGPRLAAGTFGFARETSELFAKACRFAGDRRIGLGAALGEVVEQHGGPGLDSSLLVAAHRLGIPLTVHVAIGTDIVHMWPRLDGAALGAASLDDFHSLCRLVAKLEGGVWMNLGSAVVMPEVFLKAVSIVRNLGKSLDGMTTANLDFDQKYRGLQNVLQRPGAEGVALTGHHEIMIPLLHAAVVARVEAARGGEELKGPHFPLSAVEKQTPAQKQLIVSAASPDSSCVLSQADEQAREVFLPRVTTHAGRRSLSEPDRRYGDGHAYASSAPRGACPMRELTW